MTARSDGRQSDELRLVKITRSFLRHAEGSALIEMGRTVVICSATVEESVPKFLKATGRGWVTAEYGMLPRSTAERVAREGRQGHLSGRTQEIQRLVGRSLRSVVELDALGERTILIDCDVLEADGGTRTAAITGSFVALYDAIQGLLQAGRVDHSLIRDFIAAVSVGVIQGVPTLDLCYEEDAAADVDLNLVMTGSGHLVEIQGTAEHHPFSTAQLHRMLDLGRQGIEQLVALQKATLDLPPDAALRGFGDDDRPGHPE
ncbi:MAG: ribonuclease PH [Candidatus Latescibacteria bacterium]|nr:ribonuclease PH [Candidatus Latescibacterota bacterium]